MTGFGCARSAEEHGSNALVEYVRRAEAVGFGFAGIDRPYAHRIGIDRADFFEFYEKEVRPSFA